MQTLLFKLAVVFVCVWGGGGGGVEGGSKMKQKKKTCPKNISWELWLMHFFLFSNINYIVTKRCQNS